MKKAASYARKSTYSDKSDSVLAQYKMAEEYCKQHYRNSYKLIKYEDEGYTGANTDRPGYKRLLEDIKNNSIDVVICYKIDRISRNVKDFSCFYTFLEEHKVEFVSLSEQIDTSSPLGKAMMYISSVFSQMERETTAERVRDNMLQLAISGKWAGGLPPAGYRIVKRNFEGKKHSILAKIPEDAAFLEFLANKLTVEHMSICRLEKFVVKNHLTFPSTGKITPTQLYRLLSNPIYCTADHVAYDYFSSLGCQITIPKEKFDGTRGINVYRRTRSDRHGFFQPHENWIISVGYHEPVFSSKDFITLQDCFKRNVIFKNRKYDVGLLRSIIKCKCGMHMQVIYRGNKKKRAYQAYACRKRRKYGKEFCDQSNIPIDTIDGKVLAILKEIRLDKDIINNYIPKKDDLHEVISVSNIEKAIHETEKKISNWLIRLEDADGTAASKYIINQIASLDFKKEALIKELANIQKLEKIRKEQENTTENTYKKVCEIVDNLEEFSYQELNNLLTELIEECVVKEDGTIRITL